MKRSRREYRTVTRSNLFRHVQQLCIDAGLEFENPDTGQPEFPGHPYCVFFNSQSGSKEIHCRNLKECQIAIDELIELKTTEVN